MSGYRPTHHRITGRFHVISFIVVKDCTELMLTLLLDFVATYQEMSTTALSADPAVAVPLLTINGWILMQRLVKGGPVTFNQSWVAYREGFGSATANESYWLGLEKVYRLTQLSSTALRVEVYAQITSNYTLLYFADLTKTERNQHAMPVFTDAVRLFESLARTKKADAKMHHCLTPEVVSMRRDSMIPARTSAVAPVFR